MQLIEQRFRIRAQRLTKACAEDAVGAYTASRIYERRQHAVELEAM